MHTTTDTTTHLVTLNGQPIDRTDYRDPDEYDVAFCFVCGRVTDHVAEHDDLVDLGLASHEAGGIVAIVDSEAWWAYQDALADAPEEVVAV